MGNPPLLCNFPTCPSCAHEVTNDEACNMREDLYALAPAEERAEIKCPECGVTYHCQGGYIPTYATALDAGNL